MSATETRQQQKTFPARAQTVTGLMEDGLAILEKHLTVGMQYC